MLLTKKNLKSTYIMLYKIDEEYVYVLLVLVNYSTGVMNASFFVSISVMLNLIFRVSL